MDVEAEDGSPKDPGADVSTGAEAAEGTLAPPAASAPEGGGPPAGSDHSIEGDDDCPMPRPPTPPRRSLPPPTPRCLSLPPPGLARSRASSLPQEAVLVV
ncbi:hypothetical protein JG688_00010324 [Phytophthora aleatoria]|uniref:Uncharacterized protein n=1 Tax=Phytophthora aleatoria TaxID=2496075 RepID=A0A8J5IEZ2_9STRA|nr:hypothetical protein JG688_00010324 [Phytophthora aleatoria]